MTTHGARQRCLDAALGVAVTLLALGDFEILAQTRAIEPPRPVGMTMRDDAALSAVFFVEAAMGWAVGDRGVIWHTRDGGATWQQQESHLDCTLHGVFFLDAARGWAVGGSHKPHSLLTTGVVLRTVDGGATWSTVTKPAGGAELPALHGVRFFDLRSGIAYGAAGPTMVSGVYLTRDGGVSWQPLACEQSGHWLAGDFLAPDAGAVAGPNGRFATIGLSKVTESPLAAGSLRSLRAMRLAAPTDGWLVGDGGLVARTTDLGRSWQSPPGELPAGVAEFDFRAVASDGAHAWIAGSPGSRVFRSADGGRSWNAFETGQTTPLRAIHFVDVKHGWAVGDLGVILHTRDGGRTWETQRAGGRRAALVTVFARPDDVPLELIAQEGAAEGYLTAVHLPFQFLNREGMTASSSESQTQARSIETMLLAGATGVETEWRFPLPPAELGLKPDELVAALNRANDGRGIERLVGRLARHLRMWRPDVVVTHAGQDESRDATAELVHRAALNAVAAAADPTQFVELSQAGLVPWQVQRVFGVLPPGSPGTERIVTGEFVPLLGTTLTDWAAPARRLLAVAHSSPPDVYDLALLTYSTDEEKTSGTQSRPAGRGIFRGLTLAAGGEARRRFAAPPGGDLEQLRRLAARRRNVRELLERSEGNASWVAQVGQLTDGLDAASGGELVFQLADGYRMSGRLDLAADTYYLLARNFPEHPHAEQALRWLVQFYASGETGVRMSAQTGAMDVAQATDANSGGVVQASAEAPLNVARPAVGLSSEDRLRRAVELGKHLESARPALYAEPAVRFPLVAAERRLGFANPAKRYFLSLGPLPDSDPWKRCAATEQWLAEPGDAPPPMMLGHCRRAGERPYLDGRLQESFWEAAEVLRVVNDAARSSERAGGTPAANDAEVRLAYDEQFLYLAVRCTKSESGDYTPDDRPRPRDADLSEHDRVAIRLDVDRDYTTYFELAVDHRGWTHDACWSDATWNPSWYVAAAHDEATWTIEAAVPIAQLAETPPAAKHVWAFSLRRTIPGMGHASWAGSQADDDSPEPFGLLVFE